MFGAIPTRTPPLNPGPSKTEIREFCSAAGGGKMDIVVAYLDKHKPDLTDEQHRNSIMWASVNGHADMVLFLLGKGADVNLRDKDDDLSPLMWAAYGRKDAIVSILLERNADVNVQNSTGSTALTKAATNGSLDIVKRLVANGADVNLPQKNGVTPLIEAARTNHLHVVPFLLENGADISHKCNMGYTAADWARSCKKEEMAALIETWPEMQRQKKEQEKQQARDAATAVSNARLDALKHARPARSPLMKPPGR